MNKGYRLTRAPDKHFLSSDNILNNSFARNSPVPNQTCLQMGLFKRVPFTERVPSGADCSHSQMPKEWASPNLGPRLLQIDEVPSWYGHNPYIRTGYRPVTPSASLCLSSLLHLHNETANIYSHLIPATMALLFNALLYAYFSTSFPKSTWADQLVFHIYLTTSVVCFGMSSAYHTLLCHSAHVTDLWARLDYVAIVFQILGSFISGIYIGFYCEPQLQKLYWSMVRLQCTTDGVIIPNFHLDWHTRVPNCICRRTSQAAEPKMAATTPVNICGDWTFCICPYHSCC